MKKSIKFIFLLFFCIGLIYMPAFAQSTEECIYSTDILAFVNGEPIEGFNIGGRTVVIAEDLDGYGFYYEYNDDERVLSVSSNFTGTARDYAEIARGKTGKILGKIYNTDIKVYFNGIEINGYNLNGRTAICLEDMGNTEKSPNEPYGYSKYLAKTVWNAENKTISLETYIQNKSEILNISRVYHKFKDNVIYTFQDEFYAKSEFSPDEEKGDTGLRKPYSYSENFEKNKILPLYLDVKGEKIEIGVCVNDPREEEDDIPLMHIYDTEKTKELIKSMKLPKKTHDEALEYFENRCKIIEKIENESFTVLKAEDDKEGLVLVYINKNGGFVADTFFSAYSDRTVTIEFDETGVNSSVNTVDCTVSPFAGPHGATTMHYATDLEWYDYD